MGHSLSATEWKPEEPDRSHLQSALLQSALAIKGAA